MFDYTEHKPKRLWIVRWGKYFTEGAIICVFKTKKKAVQMIKNEGFKYNKNDDLWVHDDLSEWYSVEEVDFIV